MELKLNFKHVAPRPRVTSTDVTSHTGHPLPSRGMSAGVKIPEEVFAKFFQNKLSDWQCVEGAVAGSLLKQRQPGEVGFAGRRLWTS